MKCIVMVFDTLRPDHLGCYGNDWVKTPNFDRFASQSLVFEKAYCGSWPTIPNRTDLFTGRYGEPLHGWAPLSWQALTLPEVLRDNGHICQLICDTPHLINYGYGFDRPFHAWRMIRGNEVDRHKTDCGELKLECSPEKFRRDMLETFHAQYLRNIRGRGTDEEEWFSPQVMTAAAEWLENNHGHENFFLWVDCFDPHEPWDPPQRYIDLYDADFDGEVPTNFFPPPAITERELKQICARYAGMVTMVDTWLGKVLDKLEELGIGDETCVVLTSDHGTCLGAHGGIMKGNAVYEEESSIVWMMRVPGLARPGTRSAALVQPPDLMPTLLDVAGLDGPENLQGKSLVPVMRGESDAVRNIALTGGSPVNVGGNGLYVGPKRLGVTDGQWTYMPNPSQQTEELYDLGNDPGQKENIIESERARAASMHQALVDMLDGLGSPQWVLDAYRMVEPVEVPKPPPELSDTRRRSLMRENFFVHEFG